MIFALMRILLALRGIRKAIEEANSLNRERLSLDRDRMAMEFPMWYKSGGTVPTRRKVTIEHVNSEEWVDKYNRNNPNG